MRVYQDGPYILLVCLLQHHVGILICDYQPKKNKPEADVSKDTDAMKDKLVDYVKPNVRFFSNSFVGPYGLNAFVFSSRHAKKQKY
jgi:hypothetical protein